MIRNAEEGDDEDDEIDLPLNAEQLQTNLIETEPNYPPHLILETTHTTLDTIQEDKELSLHSEEDETNLTINKSHEFSSILDDDEPLEAVAEKEEEKERKINIHWINEDDEDEEDELQNERDKEEIDNPDIDQGWAWVVLFAVFAIFCLEAGLLSSTGLYYVQMLKEFGHPRSYTAWMGSLVNAFYMLTGPVSSLFIKYTSSRAAIVFGALLAMIGYLMSAFAESLPAIFFSYGVIVAVGMNFVYSGQIIALAQYFSKFHSLATSAAMVGIGIGMFSVIHLLDLVIVELGWRNSFIICGAMTLQMIVFGCLIFPLDVPFKEELKRKNEEELKKMFSQEEIVSLLHTPIGTRLVNEQAISMNRSVSSLRLSIVGGYLSSSLISLNNDSKHNIIGSNHYSFYSRGIGLNQLSALQLQNSHSELATGFIKSNQHSFCSRGSFYGIYSLKSNPQSFCIKSSQVDLHYPLHPQVVQLRDESHEFYPKQGVPLNRSLSHISSIRTHKEGQNSILEECEVTSHSKCFLYFVKLKNAFGGTLSSFNVELLLDPMFWFLFFSIFFTMFATIKLFIIYKDLTMALGFGNYYSLAMTSIGIGDIIGRVAGGVLASTKGVNPILCYSIAMILCGVTIAFKLLATSGPVFLVMTTGFGITYGMQNVLLTIAPIVMFGKEMLVTVFGYILFAAGLGALIGAPIAGYIVDKTHSFVGVFIASVASCFLGGIFMFICFHLDRRKLKEPQLVTSNNV